MHRDKSRGLRPASRTCQGATPPSLAQLAPQARPAPRPVRHGQSLGLYNGIQWSMDDTEVVHRCVFRWHTAGRTLFCCNHYRQRRTPILVRATLSPPPFFLRPLSLPIIAKLSALGHPQPGGGLMVSGFGLVCAMLLRVPHSCNFRA